MICDISNAYPSNIAVDAGHNVQFKFVFYGDGCTEADILIYDSTNSSVKPQMLSKNLYDARRTYYNGEEIDANTNGGSIGGGFINGHSYIWKVRMFEDVSIGGGKYPTVKRMGGETVAPPFIFGKVQNPLSIPDDTHIYIERNLEITLPMWMRIGTDETYRILKSYDADTGEVVLKNAFAEYPSPGSSYSLSSVKKIVPKELDSNQLCIGKGITELAEAEFQVERNSQTIYPWYLEIGNQYSAITAYDSSTGIITLDTGVFSEEEVGTKYNLWTSFIDSRFYAITTKESPRFTSALGYANGENILFEAELSEGHAVKYYWLDIYEGGDLVETTRKIFMSKLSYYYRKARPGRKYHAVFHVVTQDGMTNQEDAIWWKSGTPTNKTDECSLISISQNAVGGVATYFDSAKHGVATGTTIDIPKDYLVKSAEIKEVAVADTPVQGYVVGDKYIDFTVNTVDGSGNESHLYLLITDLAKAYTAGAGVVISASNEVSIVTQDGTKDVEGYMTIASNIVAHAGGTGSEASKECSFAHGQVVKASSNNCEVAFGAFNKSNSDTLFSVGNGTDEDTRSNAFEITKTTGKLFDKEIATKEELETHAGNTDIHVTAENKQDWDAKLPYIGFVEDLFNVKQTCVCAWNSSTLNTPLKAGLTYAGGGLCIINNTSGSTYTSYLVMVSGGTEVFTASSNAGVIRGSWLKISDGNADTLGGKSASEFLQDIGGLTSGSLLEYALTLSTSGWLVAGPNVTDTPNPGKTFFVEVRNYDGYLELVACQTGANTVSVNNYNREIWFGWHNVADNGNAATLGGYPVGTNGKKGVLILPEDNGTLEIGQRIDFHSAGSQDFAVRLYVSPPNWDSASSMPSIRIATPDGTNANIADGGNAASVGAYTEAKLAALEARIAALERQS